MDPAPPYGVTGTPHEVKIKVANKAKGTFDRMDEQTVQMRIVTEKDTYVFQQVDFYQRWDTVAQLHLLDRGVPELIFEEEGPKSARVTMQGDNSAWGITPVMGAIPC